MSGQQSTTKRLGFLVIDKPSGITSHDCVQRLRKIYQLKRIGHGGTLDPSVTGVLPIALGSATRLLQYLPGEKSYEGTIQLGKRTTTDDLQGQLLSTESWPTMNSISIEQYLNQFRGLIQQCPPQVSSVHIKGKRAYELARQGVVMRLAPREVHIHDLEVTNWDNELGQLSFKVHCSSGTYIRSLARDLGESLGCGGCLAVLRRTQAMGFNDSQAIPLPDRAIGEITSPPVLVPAIKALMHLPRVQLSYEENEHWCTGRTLKIDLKRRQESPSIAAPTHKRPEGIVVAIDPKGEVAGIAKWDDSSYMKPKVVLNAAG